MKAEFVQGFPQSDLGNSGSCVCEVLTMFHGHRLVLTEQRRCASPDEVSVETARKTCFFFFFFLAFADFTVRAAGEMNEVVFSSFCLQP